MVQKVDFKSTDIVKLQFDCKGQNGKTAEVRTVLSVEDLGLTGNKQAAPAIHVEFDADAYSEILSRSIDSSLTPAQRAEASADAHGMLAAFHDESAAQLEAGGVTPAESLVTAVVDYAVQNGLKDRQGVVQPFSRDDINTAFRLTEAELNVSARSVANIGGDEIGVFVVSATATWGS